MFGNLIAQLPEKKIPKVKSGPTEWMLLWAILQEATRTRIWEIWNHQGSSRSLIEPISRDETLANVSLFHTSDRIWYMENLLTPCVKLGIQASIRPTALARFLEEAPDEGTIIRLYRKHYWDHLITKWPLPRTPDNRNLWQTAIEKSLFYAIYHQNNKDIPKGEYLTQLEWVFASTVRFQEERKNCFGSVQNYILTGERILYHLQQEVVCKEYCESCALPVSKLEWWICPLCSKVPTRFRGMASS